MRGRKYIVVIAFSWLIILALGFAIGYDPMRMEQAEEMHLQALVARGAELYAQNCIVCHGVAGQGHVGPPLNIAGLKGDPREDGDLYDMLYRTVAHGRPGTPNTKWQRLPNEQWASYTAMPMWGEDSGGPFNELHLRAVVHFIMMGDWGQVGRQVPAPHLVVDPATGRTDRAGTIARMLPGVGISEEASMRGREIFFDRACITCHAIGSVGHTIGPDLSRVGSWAVGMSEEEWGAWLKQWIANPQAVPDRAPTYWSNYSGPLLVPMQVGAGAREGSQGATATEEGVAGGSTAGQSMPGMAGGLEFGIEIPDPVPLPPSQMPALGLTQEELDALVTYLLSLK